MKEHGPSSVRAITKALHLGPQTVTASLRGLHAQKIGSGNQTRWTLPKLPYKTPHE